MSSPTPTQPDPAPSLHLNAPLPWPRPGHAFAYDVTVSPDGQHPVQFSLSVPSRSDQIHLPTVRLTRQGGPNADDEAFRAELYRAVGALTVAAGHAEAAMKRVLLVLTGDDSRFSTVDKTWSELEGLLRRHSGGTTERECAVRDLLDAAQRQNLKRYRDHVVHGSWWDYAGVGVTLARFRRRQDGEQIVTSLAELTEHARLTEEYATRLDDLVAGVWPEAMLPATPTPQ